MGWTRWLSGKRQLTYSIAICYIIEQFKQEQLWKVSHTQGDTILSYFPD